MLVFVAQNMFTEKNLLIASCVVIIIDSEEKRRERRKRQFWVRPSLQSRARCGTNSLILDDIDELNFEHRSECGFKNFFRISTSDYTLLRRAISANERMNIAVTLRFLATRDSYYSLSYMFKISKQISRIILNFCNVIVNVLQDYIKVRIKNSI